MYVGFGGAALTEGIAKAKKSSVPVSRKIRVDAPAAVSGDWEELVEVLEKKGIKPGSKLDNKIDRSRGLSTALGQGGRCKPATGRNSVTVTRG
jgi:hypothetical protein